MIHSSPPVLPPHPPAHRAKVHSRAAPGATVPLAVGDTVIVNGLTYVVGITLIPQGGTPIPTPTPTPTPPPVPTPSTAHVDSYVGGSTGQAITSAAPGDLLVLVGGGFGTLAAGATGRVLFNDLDGIVRLWTDTRINVTVPFTRMGVTSPHVYTQDTLSSSPRLIVGNAPPLTITAPPPPVSPKAGLYYLDDLGAPIGVGTVGQRVTILGSGFGAGTGVVRYNGIPLPVLSWADGRIQVTLATRPVDSGWITVQRADGRYRESGPIFGVKKP